MVPSDRGGLAALLVYTVKDHGGPVESSADTRSPVMPREPDSVALLLRYVQGEDCLT